MHNWKCPMKTLSLFFLFGLFNANQSRGQLSRAFEDSFDPIPGLAQKTTRDDVMDKMNQYFGLSTGIISEITELEYFDSWVIDYNCQIVFLVDERMNRLSIFHFDEGMAEPYYLYSGGDPLSAGPFSLNCPKDVDRYSLYYTNPEKFQHLIYIADFGNHRILVANYYSHVGQIDGTRGDDNVELAASFGASVLMGPTGVALSQGMSGQFFVADYSAKKIYHFSASGQVVNYYEAADFGAQEFYPKKVAVLYSGGETYIGVVSRKDYEIPGKEMNANFHLIKTNGSTIAPILAANIAGAIDVECSDDLGFLVLSDTRELAQISAEGSIIRNYDLSTHDAGADGVRCIGVHNANIGLGYEYDSDSGFSIYNKIGGAGGATLESQMVFNEFDPVAFNIKIVRKGAYTCYVRRKGSIIYEHFLINEALEVGQYTYLWQCPECWTDTYQIYILDGEKSDLVSVDEFQLQRGPYLAVQSPIGGEEFFDGERVNLTYTVAFSESAFIDSTVVYLGRWHDGVPVERWKKKPGDQNERGVVSFAFDLPIFEGETDCSHQYELELWTYYKDNGATKLTKTYVDPNIIVKCSRTYDGRDGTPCEQPCYLSDGSIWLPGGSDIYVHSVVGGGVAYFYVDPKRGNLVDIFDVRGRLVMQLLVDGTIEGIPGRKVDTGEMQFASGVYFAKLHGGGAPVCRFLVIK